jgi:cytochrome c2
MTKISGRRGIGGLMKTALVIAFAGVIVLIGGAAVSAPDSAVDHGKEVYAVQKCAVCHSISGVGGQKLPLDGIGGKIGANEMKKWIRTPKQMKADTTMKPYPNLPEKDLNDLVAFLSTLQ